MTEGTRRNHSFTVLAVILALAFAGCHSTPAANEDNGAEPSTATLSVTGATAVIKPMREEILLLGETVAQRHISLRAPSAGRVIGLNILTGDRVKRGQVVAHIISREVEAAVNGLAVARQIDPAEASSLAKSVNRYVQGEGVPVTAPEDAIVAQRIVSPGQVVADLDQLADLIDPRSLFVNAAVPVDDLARVHAGMAAIVTSPLHPGISYPGRVAGLSPSFNPAGATSTARIEFSTGQRIEEAGAPVEASITSKFVPDALVIPASALFEDAANDTYYVFVVGADGRAHRQTVTLGIRSQSEVQVTSGIASDQVVITSGGYALSDGLKVSVTLVRSATSITGSEHSY